MVQHYDCRNEEHFEVRNRKADQKGYFKVQTWQVSESAFRLKRKLSRDHKRIVLITLLSGLFLLSADFEQEPYSNQQWTYTGQGNRCFQKQQSRKDFSPPGGVLFLDK